MSIQILINNSSDPLADYVGWSPQPCQISSTNMIVNRVILITHDRRHSLLSTEAKESVIERWR